MANTNHDVIAYERYNYMRDKNFYDGNLLYEAFLRAKNGSDWKGQVQQFEISYLLELANLQKELINNTFDYSPCTTFLINERGKERVIHGEQLRDRIVKHVLCDNYLTPITKRFLIYDNSASTKNKGIDFARKRLLVHLRKFYAENKSNDGYILLIDYKKYYDNIHHDKLLNQFSRFIQNENVISLLKKAVCHSKVDVSYMNDSEYSNCMNNIFSSNEYEKIDKKLLTGKRFMAKHLNIGDQVSQTSGITYPLKIDNYVKIVRRQKYYARYSDDSYIINESKETLSDILKNIITIANSLGITINSSKTRICKLSNLWRFLQIQYSLTENGRIIQKINPKRITTMRRKMKKLSYKMSTKEYSDWFKSWIMNYKKYMSKLQLENIYKLFNVESEKCIKLP